LKLITQKLIDYNKTTKNIFINFSKFLNAEM